jgi:hypothetical protein
MEYEKARLIAKLRGARERKRKETGKKVGGSTCSASAGNGQRQMPFVQR